MVMGKEGEYISLNGNQMGALLIKYILEARKEKDSLSSSGYIVKSIVTGDLGKAIAEGYGVETYETLTGFKNICGKVNELEEEGNHGFIFGYEESIGYVAGDFVRDKDGVISSMLLSEAAAFYKTKRKSLLDILEEVYEEYGYYQEKLISLVLEGIEGQNRIKRMMEVYRNLYPKKINGMNLVKYMDYQSQVSLYIEENQEENIQTPSSNVLKFLFDDKSWYAVRPSGTEPKIKIYMYSRSNTMEESQEKLKKMEEVIMKELHRVE